MSVRVERKLLHRIVQSYGGTQTAVVFKRSRYPKSGARVRRIIVYRRISAQGAMSANFLCARETRTVVEFVPYLMLDKLLIRTAGTAKYAISLLLLCTIQRGEMAAHKCGAGYSILVS